MSEQVRIGDTVIRLESVDSTNAQAIRMVKEKKAGEGTVILADFQTAGRGQAGNSWKSEKGKNLTFSLILLPGRLEAHQQFYLLMSVSLGIHDALKTFGLKPQIKWPNDIYAEEGKIGGVLIENQLTGKFLISTVIGIGLNVNQTDFTGIPGKPVSMKMLLGKSVSRERLLKACLGSIQVWVDQLYRKRFAGIHETYQSRLMRVNRWTDFADASGSFRGKINGVRETGELIVEDKQGERKTYGFKELEFLL